MYGGLDTIKATRPRIALGNASYQSPKATCTLFPRTPSPARLALATSNASRLESVIQISAEPRGSSIASASPIAPLPVPRSTAIALCASALIAFFARSTMSSVSGRGINTRGSTIRSNSRNDQWPSTYCNGSPVRTLATIASRCATLLLVAASSSTS